ncbi:MAG: SRPBCC family protein [Anaerolineae bacterium]
MELGYTSRRVNVGVRERWFSMVLGGMFLMLGLTRGRGLITWMLAGGALFYRGLTGHSMLYQLLGREGLKAEKTRLLASGPRVHLHDTVTVQRSAEDAYRFWRDTSHLPRFMKMLKSVETNGDGALHLAMQPPGPLPVTVKWDGILIEDRKGELLAWRSSPDANIDMDMTVQFHEAPGGRGTEVRATVSYSPPGGVVGATIGRVFSPISRQQLRQDLQRFKNLIEAGEIPVTEGQPRGSR